MKTIAIIPCHNEAKHIAAVVEKARQYVDVVWVIDDYSTDDTWIVAGAAGAVVMANAFGHGLGSAVRYGLQCSWFEKAKIIVLLDGDGQHNPDEIPKLIKPIKQGTADIVMGQRVKGNMPTYRGFGIKFLTLACNIWTKMQIPDAMTGYWAVSTKSLPKLTENKWGLAVELLIKTRNNGCRMTGIPVEAIYHSKYSDNSTTSPLKLGLYLLWIIIKWRLKCEVFRRHNEKS